MQSSSDEEEFFSDFQPYEASNFPSVDLSNFSSVELSDLSTSAGITCDFKSSSILAFVEGSSIYDVRQFRSIHANLPPPHCHKINDTVKYPGEVLGGSSTPSFSLFLTQR